MKQILFCCLILLALIPQISYAHLVRNAITRTTAVVYNDKQELSILLDINVPSSELDVVFGSFDKNIDKVFDDSENKEYLSKLRDNLYINYDSVDYRPISVELLTPYNNLEQVVVPTIELQINYGKVILDQNPKEIKIYNKLKFNTVLAQDWNISLDKNVNVTFDNIGYYPDKTLVSEQLNTTIASPKGINNLSFFNRISNNELFSKVKSFLRNPDYSFQNLLIILGICAIFGALHAFQPGHGKAIIGSYLSAINGTFKDSVIMAISTTISHTFIILLLGLLWAVFKDGFKLLIPYINFTIDIPKEWINIPVLANWIRILSSLSLLIFGFFLILKSYKNYVDYKLASKSNKYDEIQLDIDSNKPFTILDHGDHKHYLPSKRLNLKESILLGINTGFTPCFDALIIFTLSISLGLGWLGFWMLLIFSIGLGISLSLIGYITAKVINKASRTFSQAEQIAVLLPIFSSIAIIIVAILNIIQ